MTKIAAIFVLMSCILSCNTPADDVKFFNLFIGTNSADFESDLSAVASGDEIDGSIFIFLNGNPVSFYGGFGSALQINQWIKPKQNELLIKGNSTKDLYVKIASYDRNGGSFKLRFKSHIKSGEINVTGLFQSDIDYNLKIFESLVGDEKPTYENDIKNEIVLLKNYIDTKTSQDLIKQLLVGPSIWQPTAYKINWSEKENIFKNRIIDDLCNSSKRILDFNKDEIKIIFGKNSAYAYSGISREQIPETYLFKLKNNDLIEYVPAIKFVKLSGKWIVWE